MSPPKKPPVSTKCFRKYLTSCPLKAALSQTFYLIFSFNSINSSKLFYQPLKVFLSPSTLPGCFINSSKLFMKSLGFSFKSVKSSKVLLSSSSKFVSLPQLFQGLTRLLKVVFLNSPKLFFNSSVFYQLFGFFLQIYSKFLLSALPSFSQLFQVVFSTLPSS